MAVETFQHRRAQCELLEPRQLLTTIVIEADADTYTRSDASAAMATILDVRDLRGVDSITYLRFDLSGITGTSMGVTETERNSLFAKRCGWWRAGLQRSFH